MTWPWGDIAGFEPVQIVGGDLVEAGVLEGDPRESSAAPGQTGQRVQLLLPDGRRLDPPARVVARGVELRVLGSKLPPWAGEPSIALCERVNPDLPDELTLVRVTEAFDEATNAVAKAEVTAWVGLCHVSSGNPRLTDVAEERAPTDRVTITCAAPLTGADLDDLWARVTVARNKQLVGLYKLVGEVLDSNAVLRRFTAERRGWL